MHVEKLRSHFKEKQLKSLYNHNFCVTFVLYVSTVSFAGIILTVQYNQFCAVHGKQKDAKLYSPRKGESLNFLSADVKFEAKMHRI